MSFARFRILRRRMVMVAMLGALALPATAAAATPGEPVSWFTSLAQRFGPDTGAETASAVAVRGDGRVVASIVNDGELDRRIIGLLPNGQLDPTFSGDGIWSMSQGNVTVVRAVTTTADGKTIFAGDDHSQMAIVVGRLMSDGELDPTFGGGDGLAVYGTGDGSSPTLEQVFVQSSGKIVFAGSVNDATMGRQLLIGRLNADGSDDGTFNGSPYMTFGSAVAALDDRFAGVAQMSNGEFILGGSHDGGASEVLRIGPSANYAIVKDLELSANADQTVDVVAVDATHVAVLSTGADWSTSLALVRVDATPALDLGYGGGDGVASLFPASFRGVQLLRQPDGKFVVAGFDSGHRAIVRLNADGSLDGGFGTGGEKIFDGSSQLSTVLRSHEIALSPEGSIVSASHINADTLAITAIDRIVGRIARLRSQVLTPIAAPLPATSTPVILRVTNDGPDSSGAGTVTFSATGGVEVLSSDGGCTFTGASQGSCPLADLAPGASKDITLQVRRATAGTGTISMNASAITFDDDPTNNTSSLGMTFATGPAAASTTPTGTGGGGTTGGGGGSGPATPMLTIRRVTTKGGTVLRCGLTGRFACATAKVRTGVRTIPMWIRIRSNPVPGTAKRTVSVQLQRLEKGTYVKRGGGTIDLPSTGVLDIQVPAATRGTVSYWRWRLYAPASKTTLFARSAWFYVRVK
jgi:uncharacterized delta-60 repeat protein